MAPIFYKSISSRLKNEILAEEKKSELAFKNARWNFQMEEN
jgi:hypothetical protein